MKLLLLIIASILTACGGCGGGTTSSDTSQPIQPKSTVDVVFIGASLIKQFDVAYFFPSLTVVNSGSNGETTAQMLARFNQDVIQHHPRKVLILGGTNDVIRLSNPNTENIRKMAESARANGIEVIICLNPPIASSYASNAGVISTDIRPFNNELRAMAMSYSFAIADVFTPLADANGEPFAWVTTDGVHLTNAAYSEVARTIAPLL